MTNPLLRKPFLTYIRQHRRPFAMGLTALVLTNALDTLPPLLIGQALDQVLGPRKGLALTLSLLVLVTVLLSFCRYGWRLFWGRFHHSVADDLRNRVMDHFLLLGPSYFQKTQIGRAMSLITSDVNLFRMAIGPGILILLDGITILLLVPPMMCLISPSWTLKTLCLMPLAPFFVMHVMKKLNVLYTAKQESFANMSGVAQENVAGVRVIKSLALELHQILFFNKFSKNYELASNNVARVDSSFTPVLEVFASVGSVILLVVGAPEVLSGAVSVGQFLSFFQYVQRMIWPMTSIGVGLTHIGQGKAAFRRIREVLETEPLILDEGLIEISEFQELEIRNLSFGFGDRMILSDVSLNLTAGQKLGIIGPTGSGKSVLLDLIFRLHKAPINTIFINGIAIENIKTSSLRRLFAIVPQDVFLFQDSLQANLQMGNPAAKATHLMDALEASALSEEVDNLTTGLQTELGERGVNFSGGQKQRLTLARAFLKESQVMVLDDSLSAVDSKTEAHVLSRLNTQQTLIVVTHRLSALESMDHVLVLNKGQREAFGDLRTLRTSSATVKQLALLQEQSLE